MILLTKPEKTFLVRFSTSSRGYFTISRNVMMEEGVTTQHIRIVHKPCASLFEISSRQYTSLAALVEGEALNLGLLEPCLPPKYSYLSISRPLTGYHVMQ